MSLEEGPGTTGPYSELGEPSNDEAGLWHLESLASPPPLVLNPRVDTRLNALILRMLSVSPEQRGTAQELADALEQAAQLTLPESTRSLFDQEMSPLPPAHDMAEAQAQAPQVSSLTPRSAERVSPLVHLRPCGFGSRRPQRSWPWSHPVRGAPRAGARFADRQGRAKCSTMAPTPPLAVSRGARPHLPPRYSVTVKCTGMA
ncbi:hypothetical protein [Hyalangium sp.]|uniref:hypothetical protein n=1 Tax=Hyalangium sp. TaxID=2028555 RepID=UPI002D659BFF|nr:hypothetical protein [Hyalangium sp.]HYH98362.1 hypothetical protein [Hyalangium sp.]